MNSWKPFDEGRTIGTLGVEGSRLIFDEEHEEGARISLEKCGTFWNPKFVITCGVYGWMLHTNFASKKKEAIRQYELMRIGLERILERIPLEAQATDENTEYVHQAIGEFIEHFQ